VTHICLQSCRIIWYSPLNHSIHGNKILFRVACILSQSFILWTSLWSSLWSLWFLLNCAFMLLCSSEWCFIDDCYHYKYLVLIIMSNKNICLNQIDSSISSIYFFQIMPTSFYLDFVQFIPTSFSSIFCSNNTNKFRIYVFFK